VVMTHVEVMIRDRLYRLITDGSVDPASPDRHCH
jgi:hypothetical protein